MVRLLNPNWNAPTVLFVGVGNPWKGGAGYLVRQEMFLSALAECGQLHLALFDHDGSYGVPGDPMALTKLPIYPPADESRFTSLAKEMFSPLPMMFRQADTAQARKIVQQLDPLSFDAVFAYRFDFGYFAGVLNHPRLILDIDDPEHLRRRERLHTLGEGGWHWRAELDLARLRRFERKVARRALAAFVCQEKDQQAFDSPQPIIVPNCVEAPPTCPRRQATIPTVLFLGNLEGSSESPNVDALNWFIREIWPLVRLAAPQARLHIAGPISVELREQLSIHPRVKVLGFVDRLDETLKRASLSIAPIRFGTGTRVKILQSMAWGCPVVSTPKGCEGIDAVPGRDILIGATPEEFAESCRILLTDESRQQSVGQGGYELVVNNYERGFLHARLVGILGRIIRNAARQRADRLDFAEQAR